MIAGWRCGAARPLDDSIARSSPADARAVGTRGACLDPSKRGAGSGRRERDRDVAWFEWVTSAKRLARLARGPAPPPVLGLTPSRARAIEDNGTRSSDGGRGHPGLGAARITSPADARASRRQFGKRTRDAARRRRGAVTGVERRSRRGSARRRRRRRGRAEAPAMASQPVEGRESLPAVTPPLSSVIGETRTTRQFGKTGVVPCAQAAAFTLRPKPAPSVEMAARLRSLVEDIWRSARRPATCSPNTATRPTASIPAGDPVARAASPALVLLDVCWAKRLTCSCELCAARPARRPHAHRTRRGNILAGSAAAPTTT